MKNFRCLQRDQTVKQNSSHTLIPCEEILQPKIKNIWKYRGLYFTFTLSQLSWNIKVVQFSFCAITLHSFCEVYNALQGRFFYSLYIRLILHSVIQARFTSPLIQRNTSFTICAISTWSIITPRSLKSPPLCRGYFAAFYAIYHKMLAGYLFYPSLQFS